MILNIFLLLVGFIFLIKGADLFVDGTSSIAQNLKISKMLIGLTIVAFGTSTPEFAVSMSALASGSTDIVLGNVIGSCITNALLILGVAAVIKPIKVKDNTINKELPLCLIFSALLLVVYLDIKLNNQLINQITRSDAMVILVFFTIFIYYIMTFLRQKIELNEDEKPKFKLVKSLILVVIGLMGIVFGSNLVVKNSSAIATIIGLSERIIALTIIAFGTSLPELITTIVSAKKGEQDLLLGNIIGSNIFNICVVLGIPVLIYGNLTSSSFQLIDLIMLVGSALLLFIFAETKRTITRCQGLILLAVFVVYYVLVFVI